ncbi:hypothetical protein [Mesorhizobium qingshengii]|uniref:Uncharacterized protein n=1 Tax=Mesorhizobium qingshengii TaxID=1165689 RepID=A0A1G5Z762_9HYPH|nr:hypothetical protein [Mesorhizobium qingshengii]SDA90432.1 hypothetical protein SAMN02927914_04351 [Mesorhizobium qingshengii]
MPDNLSEIDGILHAFGEMNAAWGHYEDALFMLLFTVLDIRNGTAEHAIRNEIDLKTAAAILKSAAVIDEKLKVRDHVLQLVKWTDRPMREDRNRFVHDPIYGGGPGFEQFQYVTRTKRPQSFKPLKVSVISARPITKELLRSFTNAIRKAESFSGAIQHHLSEEPDDFLPLTVVEERQEELAKAIASYMDLTKSPAS